MFCNSCAPLWPQISVSSPPWAAFPNKYCSGVNECTDLSFATSLSFSSGNPVHPPEHAEGLPAVKGEMPIHGYDTCIKHRPAQGRHPSWKSRKGALQLMPHRRIQKLLLQKFYCDPSLSLYVSKNVENSPQMAKEGGHLVLVVYSMSLCRHESKDPLKKRGRLTNEQGKTARHRGPPRRSGLGCSANSSSAGVKDTHSHLCPHTKTLSSLSL